MTGIPLIFGKPGDMRVAKVNRDNRDIIDTNDVKYTKDFKIPTTSGR